MAHWKVAHSDLEFGKKIGEGNFGAVFEGKYLGSPAAIKKLFFVDDEFMQKYIEREMETLTSLHHPNIVQLVGICIENNEVFIITEFVSGGSLRKKLKDQSIPLDWPLKVYIAKNLALALTYLHTKNIIHRDLKSHNLLVAENWKIKVCDFGLARSDKQPQAGGAKAGFTIVGTDDWMAPEVAAGIDYDRSCDVFSFGIVLFEIISRQKPLQRDMLTRYAFVPDKWKASIPKDTPEALWTLLCDCCQTDPKSRPDFKDIVKRLDDISKEVGEPNFSAPLSPALATPSKTKSDGKKKDGKKKKKKTKKEGAKKEGAGKKEGTKKKKKKTAKKATKDN
jgi:serine/threonine protein kinase